MRSWAIELGLLSALLVLVGAELEYYPDSYGDSYGGDPYGAPPAAYAEVEAEERLERLARLLERRSHRRREDEAERARRQWSARLLERLRDEAELPDEALELLRRHHQQQQQQQQPRRQQQQQHEQRLHHQHLDYPEQEHEQPFVYSWPAAGRSPSPESGRPFAVGPNDPRFHSSEVAWLAQPSVEHLEAAVKQRVEQRVELPLEAKVEQRRAGPETAWRRLATRPEAPLAWLVGACSGALAFGLVLGGLLWWRLARASKAARDVDYPAYGVTGPNKDLGSPSAQADQRLAHCAQMYHFQHQKQQIIAMEKAQPREPTQSVSEADSDEDNDEGDYTVYECPGLAPTAEMEVKNPLFHDEPTPQTPPNSATHRDL